MESRMNGRTKLEQAHYFQSETQGGGLATQTPVHLKSYRYLRLLDFTDSSTPHAATRAMRGRLETLSADFVKLSLRYRYFP
ncbi:uncharacterized protein LAJ45_11014 [Morchella importuna]|uniref:uncharacterized protein n=1 Tax=Morchella importuna TaxID=1174673 RepID=UPI001E8E64F0|nr:uncharacterized protein LAJ45_11014 [Morchella importuna]KAH8144994.1 hypothetical protein LAJ45_11014 [Morchella importuna]